MRINTSNVDKVFKAKACSIDTMELLGFELIDNLFADSSGFGMDNEPALSVNQFKKRVHELVREHGTLTAKITGQGMFQVYVGLFKKTGNKQAKQIASNTYFIDRNDGKRVIRLYETDIITDNGNGTITLNTGGYNTVTTKKRMNEFTNVHISQKNWELYANGTKFNDNDTITVDGYIRGV